VVQAGLVNPTSIQFGPDGRLYAAEQRGSIVALTLHRTFAGSYEVLAREEIDEVRRIANHDDDGSDAVDWSAVVRFAAAKTGVCCEFPQHTPPPADERADSRPDRGRGAKLFTRAGCAGCHTFAPARSVAYSGPPLNHLPGLPRRYVVQGIVAPDAALVPGYPPGRMPDDYDRALSDAQLADLVAFLRER
jgi:mono/diheme cytochrome c family protein